jgi:hypothetical protein
MFKLALLPGKYDRAAQCKHQDLGQQIQPAVPKSIFQVFPYGIFSISAKKPNFVNVPKKVFTQKLNIIAKLL